MHCISKVKVSLVILFLIFLGASVWAQAPVTPVAPTTVAVTPTVIETPQPIFEEAIDLVNLPMADIIKALGSDPIVSKLIEGKGPTPQIVVRGTTKEIEYAKGMISYLDHPVGYEMIRLSNIQTKEFSLNFAANPLMKLVTVDDINNRLAINGGTAEDVAEIKKMVKYIDKPKARIRAECVALTTSDLNSKGYDFTGSVERGQPQPNGLFQYSIGGAVLSLMKTQGDMSILSKLLWYEDHGLTKTLTRPGVTTMSGVPVTLNAGNTLYAPNPNLNTGSSNGVSLIPASILIEVLPVVLPDGRIMAKIKISIPDTSTISGTSNIPIVTVSNNVVDIPMIILLDGQSLLIGGFIYTSEKDSRSGVPIIKYIPILRDLLSYRSKTKTSFEMTMAVTFSIEKTATTAPRVEAIKEEVKKRAPIGTPGIEKPTLGTTTEPTPKVSGTTVLETKEPIEVGSKVVILNDGANKGRHGVVKNIRPVETTMLDGSKTSRPEYEVVLDSGETLLLTSEDLQVEVVEPPTSIESPNPSDGSILKSETPKPTTPPVADKPATK